MYYVTAIESNGQRTALLLGPFRTHGAALAQVSRARSWAWEHAPRHAHGALFGTSRHKTGHPPGRFNDEIGYTGPGELP